MKDIVFQNFTPGQLVIAKWDIGATGVMAGDVKEVLQVQYCSKCNNQLIDVGINHESTIWLTISCTICKHKINLKGEEALKINPWFLNSYNFEPYNGPLFVPTDRNKLINHLKIINN